MTKVSGVKSLWKGKFVNNINILRFNNFSSNPYKYAKADLN